jgi:hypothetical protein
MPLTLPASAGRVDAMQCVHVHVRPRAMLGADGLLEGPLRGIQVARGLPCMQGADWWRQNGGLVHRARGARRLRAPSMLHGRTGNVRAHRPATQGAHLAPRVWSAPKPTRRPKQQQPRGRQCSAVRCLSGVHRRVAWRRHASPVGAFLGIHRITALSIHRIAQFPNRKIGSHAVRRRSRKGQRRSSLAAVGPPSDSPTRRGVDRGFHGAFIKSTTGS